MIEKPILFNTYMVNAILLGIKKETRRLNGLEIINKDPSRYLVSGLIDGEIHVSDLYTLDDFKIKCPWGKPGVVLWVRESFYESISEGLNGKYFYKADLEKQGWDFKWKPSIHMPKKACRLKLKTVSIKIERLHSISAKSAIAEGIERIPDCHWWKNYLNAPLPGTSLPQHSFKTLWQSIYGENSWIRNPWVWVLKFEKIK